MADIGQYGCISITGGDAGSFLQGQLSIDVCGLDEGAGRLSSYNDPKGRVIALPRLIRGPDGYHALLPRELCESTARRLAMFLLRANARVQYDASVPVYAARGPEAGAWLVERHIPAICMPAVADLYLWPAARPEHAPRDGLACLEPDELALLETGSGIPEVYARTAGVFVAQMLDLDRLGAISYDKGCYVGQEVIARAHHLGRVKRHLARLEATAACAPGDEVRGDAGKVGNLVRLAPGGFPAPALAVIRDGTSGPLTVGDARLVPSQPD